MIVPVEEPERKPSASHRLLWVFGVVAVLVAAAVVTVTVVVLDRVAETPAPAAAALPRDTEPVPLGARKLCGAWMIVSADTDEAMTRLSRAFRDDPKARRVFTETKEQAYARFKELFAEDKELLSQVRPKDLPAAVHVLPVAGTDLAAWENELRQRFPEASKVQVNDQKRFVAELPTSVSLPPCPPGGGG